MVSTDDQNIQIFSWIDDFKSFELVSLQCY